jgi:hypothetical protein
MKRLWVAAALAPLSFAAMAPVRVLADTSVTTSTTAPLQTATAGNVTISGGGSIKPSAGPAAVIANTHTPVVGNVTNGGTISYSGVNDAAGIWVDTSGGGVSSTIINTGAIAVDENTTGVTTNQGIKTGPFANGGNRTGILVNGGNITVGNITNSGTITVIGENSAGIAINSELNGSLTNTGNITVTGGTPAANTTATSNVSTGIVTNGKIDGNVTVGGTVTATGENATGVALNGDVGGTVLINGAVTATGYRSTTTPDATVIPKLNADQTLQGGPALIIGGNVAGGIITTAASAALGNIAAVPQGSLTSQGSAPALLIGGNSAITIGPSSVGGYDLTIGGPVAANGVYPDVSATGIQIGGNNPLPVPVAGVPGAIGDATSPFGAVTMSGGIDILGSVVASSIAHTSGKADTTGILIGSGAAVSGAGNHSALTVEGGASVVAVTDSDVVLTGGSTDETRVTDGAAVVPVTATAIKIAPGGSVTTLTNDGSISAIINGVPASANVTAKGGTQGQAIAINDSAGTLTSVKNTGLITAAITPIVTGASVDSAHSAIVAMYLGNTDGNVSVIQQANANTSITPTITGAVIFGNSTIGAGNITGSESLDLETGLVNGSLTYNGSGNNSLTINGGAVLSGGLAQASAGNLSITVNQGALNMTAPAANAFGGPAGTINGQSFTVGANGTVLFAVDPNGNVSAPQFNVTTASIASGAHIGANVLTKLSQTGNLTVTLIQAGNLSVGAGVEGDVAAGLLPFLYNGQIQATANQLNLLIGVKAADDASFGFNAAERSAFNAIYSQIGEDPAVLAAVLSKVDRGGLTRLYDQFLPDYAGGPFESLATGQRALAQTEAEQPVKMQSDGVHGWVQEIGYLNRRESSDKANGYDASGFGLAGGIERDQGKGAVGLAMAFFSSGVGNDTQTADASLSTVAIEVGAYARQSFGGLNVNASVNGGYVALGSHRLLLDQTTAGAVTLLRDAESQWNGAIGSGQIGISYQATMGRFYMRPEASADYVMLYESGHNERGGANKVSGGDSLDLGINSRLSTQASVQGDLVLGYTFGTAMQWRPEVMIGYRQVVTGGPASTTAHFLSGGSAFTLSPDLSDRGGLLARLGLHAGGNYADISADAGGEFRNGYQTYDARAVARFLF